MSTQSDELNRGPWTAEEDLLLTKYLQAHGIGCWRTLPKKAGLLRCGKSCRLRWMNYLRPNVKRGDISQDEEELIIRLHNLLGNRWSLIAGRMPGRTDNEVKNYWNTRLSRKLARGGIDPKTHRPLISLTDKRLSKKPPFAMNSAHTLKIKGFESADLSVNQKQTLIGHTVPKEETCINTRSDTMMNTADMDMFFRVPEKESAQEKNRSLPNGIVISNSNVEYSTHGIHDGASEVAEAVHALDRSDLPISIASETICDDTAVHVDEKFIDVDASGSAESNWAEQNACDNSYYNAVPSTEHCYCPDNQLVMGYNCHLQELYPYSEVGEYLHDFSYVHVDEDYQCQGAMPVSDLWSLL